MRSNEQIRISPVRLIDQDKNMLGVVPTDEAMRKARTAGMDLVEVSPNERPPVCRIMDYGKHKYQQSKKTKQKHHEQKMKEVRLRPKTDAHDKEIKLKRARGFLGQGDRVQFTMLFRGRERFHREVSMRIFDDIVKVLEDVAKVDRPARALGRRMTMVLAPLKATTGAGAKPKPAKPMAKVEAAEAPAKPSVATQPEKAGVGNAQNPAGSEPTTETPPAAT